MGSASKKTARRRLSWIKDYVGGITRATGDIVIPEFKVSNTTDPLKYLLRLTLTRPLSKSTRNHLRDYIRCGGKDNNCEIPIIRITDQHIIAEVLIKDRVWSRDALIIPEKVSRRFGKPSY